MKRRLFFLAILCVFLLPAVSFGNVIPLPEWDWQNGDRTLWARWANTWGYATEGNWGASDPDAIPSAPRLSFLGDAWGFEIDAFNYDNFNPLKRGWVMLAVDDEWAQILTPSLVAESWEPVPDQDVGELKYSDYSEKLDKWVYVWTFELEPNPCFESIYINLLSNVTDNFANCANEDCFPEFYIKMATQCVVPIPGAVWLFGAGLLGLLGFRKRVKK
jgi:hypothetical protein